MCVHTSLGSRANILVCCQREASYWELCVAFFSEGRSLGNDLMHSLWGGWGGRWAGGEWMLLILSAQQGGASENMLMKVLLSSEWDTYSFLLS